MRHLLIGLLGLTLLLAGCGGDGASVDTEEQAGAPDTGTADAGTTQPSVAEPTSNPKDEAGLDLDEALSEAAATPTAAEPTATPTPTGPPTEDLPGGRYVEITSIATEGQTYAVDFEPYNFVPLIGEGSEDFHVHFFFNTVEPQNAGTNGPSPAEWFLYDGPSPFTGYGFADRPPAATQLCALVADAAHGVTVGSGNCLTLP